MSEGERAQGPEGSMEPTSETEPTPAWSAETEGETAASDEADGEALGTQSDLSGAALGEGIPGNVREYPEPTEDDAPSRD